LERSGEIYEKLVDMSKEMNIPRRQRHSPLADLYRNLNEGHWHSPVTMFHSNVHYCKAAFTHDEWELLPEPSEEVQEAFRATPIEDINQIMLEEGLLPWYEYGIPRWFARKWLPECRQRKKK
jgi:hypothetical protein